MSRAGPGLRVRDEEGDGRLPACEVRRPADALPERRNEVEPQRE